MPTRYSLSLLALAACLAAPAAAQPAFNADTVSAGQLDGIDANGQPLASTLADYLLPGATEIPAIRIYHLETPSPYTEFGVKGLPEPMFAG